MNNDQQKYGTLIAKLMAGRTTPEEEEELENWMLWNDDNLNLFQALTNDEKTAWAKQWFAEAGINTKGIEWKDTSGWYRTDTDTTAGFYMVTALILLLMGAVYWILKYM